MSLSNSQYFTASIAGLTSSILPFGSGIGVLGTAAAFTGDEFYSQTKLAHQISTLVVSGSIAAGSLFAGNIANNILGNFLPPIGTIVTGSGLLYAGTTLLINEIITPVIADEIHEYTHPHTPFSIEIHNLGGNSISDNDYI